MSTIALTGHTGNLGSVIKNVLENKGHVVQGFSKSTGTDLRDYNQVGHMIQSIKNHDWFINCAHPDYCQSQILYRLLRLEFSGKILSIGSAVVHNDPGWTDLGLIEYVNQKTALWHAHNTLTQLYPGRFWLWAPAHTGDKQQALTFLETLGL